MFKKHYRFVKSEIFPNIQAHFAIKPLIMGYVRHLFYIIATCFTACLPGLIYATSAHIKPGKQVPLNSALIGRWRGQEEDIVLELEFKKDGTMIIRDISSKKANVFNYSISGRTLRTIDSKKVASTQLFTIRGDKLNLRKPNLKPSESIDLLYDLTFYKML